VNLCAFSGEIVFVLNCVKFLLTYSYPCRSHLIMKFVEEYRDKSDALQEIAREYFDELRVCKDMADLTPLYSRFVEVWNQRYVMASAVAPVDDLLAAIAQGDVDAKVETRLAFDLLHHNRAFYHDVLGNQALDAQGYLTQMAVASGKITNALYYNPNPTISQSAASLLTSQWYEAGQNEDLHSHLDPDKVEAALHASALEHVIKEHFPNVEGGFGADIEKYRDSYMAWLGGVERLSHISTFDLDNVANTLTLDGLEAA